MWTNITDEKIANIKTDGYIVEEDNVLNIGKYYTTYAFFRVAENTYCSKDEVSKTTEYTFYYNPTETPTLESFINLLTNYYTIEQANDTFVSKADFNGENLFDNSGFSILDDGGMNIIDGISGTVYKIFDKLYTVNFSMFIMSTLPTGNKQYNGSFTLKNGTNLLDKSFGNSSPLQIYDRAGNIVGTCMLGLGKMQYNITSSVDIYIVNGLLSRL